MSNNNFLTIFLKWLRKFVERHSQKLFKPNRKLCSEVRSKYYTKFLSLLIGIYSAAAAAPAAP